MEFGIDSIAAYTPKYFLSSKSLARARNVDSDKFIKGLGIHEMSVLPPDEDIVTMAAEAAERVVRISGKENIENVFFATESSIDQSKSAGLFVHGLLDLPKNCRVIEVKQACYSATAAIRMAIGACMQRPNSKALIIASDVAKYGFESAGEPTQGCGAVAMIISANPRIATIEPEFGLHTEDAYDFWRPNYLSEACVDGKFSIQLYLKALGNSWNIYAQESKREYNDHKAYCFHVPFPKMAQKAIAHLFAAQEVSPDLDEYLTHLEESLVYSKITGNAYTASLYISLLSLLENSRRNLGNERIGIYSYGSGCVAEFLSCKVNKNYQNFLDKAHHRAVMFDNREEISFAKYEEFYNFQLPQDGSELNIPTYSDSKYKLTSVIDHKRIYSNNFGIKNDNKIFASQANY